MRGQHGTDIAYTQEKYSECDTMQVEQQLLSCYISRY